MTALQQLLFDYALEHYFSFFLTDGEYRECDACAARQIDALKAQLSREEWNIVEKYWDTRETQRGLELEAMFQSALAMARELP
ncbi:MAG: hypothetical protein RR350_07560 [Oscillibacter sp.]